MKISSRLAAAVLLFFTLGFTPSITMPDFSDGTGWINSSGLRPVDLQGKVVLVDFWEYTCVNCLRTLPYLREWYKRYRDDGLVIVGVHTPEFDFSGEVGNVEAATRRLDITWPVVVDSRRNIWSRYNNESWPKEYLFDQDGVLVDTVSGEGHYEETEARIQSLLKAHNSKLTLPPVMALLPQDNYTKPGALCYLHTPEILIGHTKIADPDPAASHRGDAVFTDPGTKHTDGAVYLQGEWHVGGEQAASTGTPGYLDLQYHAVQVVGVLSPAKASSERLDVTQDGAPVGKDDAGTDIKYDPDGTSYVIVDASRAYELVMNAKMGNHDLRLTPAVSGSVNVFSFAFESCEAAPKA